MPKFLEDKLRREYGNNPSAIYGTMNKLGAMHGNQETAKGREMERKHEADMKKAGSVPSPMRELRVEIHRGPKAKVSGFTVHHHMMPKPVSKTGAFMEETHHSFPFDAKGESSTHGNMMDHIEDHVMGGGGESGGEPGGESAEQEAAE